MIFFSSLWHCALALAGSLNYMLAASTHLLKYAVNLSETVHSVHTVYSVHSLHPIHSVQSANFSKVHCVLVKLLSEYLST